jgi:hypothetical protein
MRGYSDQINHAFAFVAKYRSPRAPATGAMHFMAHPANVAVILARHGVDDLTLVAGILHHVLEATTPHEHDELCQKIGEKFGSVILAVVRDAADPCYDALGAPLEWAHRKRLLLGRLLTMSPRAIDICCADELHECGSTVALVERLGPEYLATAGLPAGPPALCWYDDLLEALAARVDWPGHGLREEIVELRRRLADAMERHG